METKKNKYMKRITLVLLGISLTIPSIAQPPARRKVLENQEQATQKAPAESQRAQLEFPTQAPMPNNVIWRRDIYRSLDLTKDANATLYYPPEPKGEEVNLFTYLFKLILRSDIKAYDYKLDGNENFEESNRVKGKDLMDRYHIFYETKDGKIRVNDNDLPSAEVLTYYIKESVYFDQRTTTYHTKVDALCPVLRRSDEFGSGSTPYPMFWVKYDDISSFLAKLSLMGSNLNNAATLSADDYFTMNRYEGKIYKTNNLQNKVLASYCTTDSAMAKEQKRIEKELQDFERHVWGKDSTQIAKKALNDTIAITTNSKKVKEEKKSSTGSTRRSSTKVKESKPKSSSSSSTPRVSVRRQRH